jgi:beta-RFAP synthase
MIHVSTGSRLHFGLFVLPGEDDAPTHWPDRDGAPCLPARRFGGVGLMIDGPGVALSAVPAAEWSAHGPGAARALVLAQHFCQALHLTQPFRIVLERCAPEHVGLGTGTQLALAVGHALAQLTGHEDLAPADLARLLGRGRRSALGIHGFRVGNNCPLLVEAGKRTEEEISPIVAWHALPETWCAVLVIPAGLHGDHGARELEAFRQLSRTRPDLGRTDALSRLVLLGMLPAAAEEDLNAFGEAVYDFNRRVGEMFAPWQGGLYSHPRVEAIVGAIRRSGVTGTGQSSWGPTVFALVGSVEDGRALVAQLRQAAVIAEHEWDISTIGGRTMVRQSPDV